MTTPIIELKGLTRRYGKLDRRQWPESECAARTCYGFLPQRRGQNHHHQVPAQSAPSDRGTVRSSAWTRKKRGARQVALAYVPDAVAFYPWMTVRDTLNFLASFRPKWNREVESSLLQRFELDPAKKTSNLSKGQKTQLA